MRTKPIRHMYQIPKSGEEAKYWKEVWGEEFEDSYRLTDSYIRIMEDDPFREGHLSLDEEATYRPENNKLVHSGSWVLVLKEVPISEQFRPVVFGMYWGIPCRGSRNNDGYDERGAYKIEIMVKHKTLEHQYDHVGLFPYEYMVISEELFQEFMDEGYFHMQQLAHSNESPINLELIEKGRSLFEEERESIWALQLDGLTESQACEEYFHGRHIKEENKNIWYNPIPEFKEWMLKTFGSVINGSTLTEENCQRRQKRVQNKMA